MSRNTVRYRALYAVRTSSPGGCAPGRTKECLMTTDLSDGTATASGGRAAAHRAPFSEVGAVRRIDHDCGTDDDERYRGVFAANWSVGPRVHGGTVVAGSAGAATAWLRESEPERAAMSPIAVRSDFLGAPEP